MRHAVCLANFGSYADPRLVVRLSRAAEAAGWDGLFVWDHLAFVWGPASADPWVTLAAVAASTESLTLGTAVTPLPRRRPQVVAQQLATLDALNGGRVVFGAGLGGNRAEFAEFGEDFDPRRRARLLDDGLDLVRTRWQGPVWIGGNSAPALRRASRWDGWIPNSLEPHAIVMTPDELAEKISRIGPRESFEVAVNGYSDPGDTALRRGYEEAGATWWLENLHDARLAPDEALARVEAGPEGAAARPAEAG